MSEASVPRHPQVGPIRTIAVAFSAYPNHALIFGLALLVFGGSATSVAVLLLTKTDAASHTIGLVWAVVVMVLSFLMAAIIVALLSAKGSKGGFRELVNDKEINPLLVTIREGIERAISVNHRVFRHRIVEDLTGIAAFVANWRNCELHLRGPGYYETLRWLYEGAGGEIKVITTPENLAEWQRRTGASQNGRAFCDVIDQLVRGRQGVTMKKILFCESANKKPANLDAWMKGQRDLGFSPALYIDDEHLTVADAKSFEQNYHVFDNGDVVVRENPAAASVLSGVMFFMNPEKQKETSILWNRLWENREKSYDLPMPPTQPPAPPGSPPIPPAPPSASPLPAPPETDGVIDDSEDEGSTESVESPEAEPRVQVKVIRGARQQLADRTLETDTTTSGPDA